MGSVDDEFTTFAATASGSLLGTAFLLCGDWHIAEDLTQTTNSAAFTPDGKILYVGLEGPPQGQPAGKVMPIQTATQRVGKPVNLDGIPGGIVIVG